MSHRKQTGPPLLLRGVGGGRPTGGAEVSDPLDARRKSLAAGHGAKRSRGLLWRKNAGPNQSRERHETRPHGGRLLTELACVPPGAGLQDTPGLSQRLPAPTMTKEKQNNWDPPCSYGLHTGTSMTASVFCWTKTTVSSRLDVPWLEGEAVSSVAVVTHT